MATESTLNTGNYIFGGTLNGATVFFLYERAIQNDEIEFHFYNAIKMTFIKSFICLQKSVKL